MWYFQVMGPVKSKPVLTMKIEHCLQLSVQAAVELNRNETEKIYFSQLHWNKQGKQEFVRENKFRYSIVSDKYGITCQIFYQSNIRNTCEEIKKKKP